MFPRDLPQPFVAGRSELEPLLDGAGFRLAGECYHPESFGSAYAEYKRRGRKVRLVWDGKDQWLWLEASPHGNDHPATAQYRDVEALIGQVPAGYVVEPRLVPQRVGELRAALGVLLDE